MKPRHRTWRSIPAIILATVGLLLPVSRAQEPANSGTGVSPVAPAADETCLLDRLRAAAEGRVVQLLVEPPEITISDARDTHSLVVTAQLADGTQLDVTRAVTVHPLDPHVILVDRGMVRPVVAGQTAIQVSGFGHSVSVPVTVQEFDPQLPVSFQNEVMTVLTRMGCNSGACHGAAAGKNGFKLSLLGYDPAGDHGRLTHDMFSRRLDLSDPERSLILLKPSGAIPHEGGRRFEPGDEYYELLRRWIAQGAPSDVGRAPALVGLRVSPEYRVYADVGFTQQLLVLAEYSDGTVRDVTRHASYLTNNEATAAVSATGLVSLEARGEAAVTVRFGDRVAVSRVMVLVPNPNFQWPAPPEQSFIDTLVFEKLRDMQIAPSELCTDAEFLRRVSLDLIGIPPTTEEVRAFLADSDPNKRSRVIDELLVRPEHADFWALKWSDLLRVRRNTIGDRGVWAYHRWIREAVATNMPYDDFARAIITATGDQHENPASYFYRVNAERDDRSENIVQLFTGVRLLCARCHDHPFERWTQRDYYGMSAFFSQVAVKGSERFDTQYVFVNAAAPRAAHPNTGEQLLPRVLGGEPADIAPNIDARTVLADWLTGPDNPYFARAQVNRVWAELFGRAIVDPVDDIRISNPPSNQRLLDALAQDFIAHGYDVRHLIRTICNSRTYQLSSTPNDTNEHDETNFSHAYVRRLTAEQLLDTIAQVTGIPEPFNMVYNGGPGQTAAVPAGPLRASQLADSQIVSYFLDTFGRPVRESSCSCERRQEATMTQALHLINGETVARRLVDPTSRVMQLVASQPDNRTLVEELYLATLCRYPTEREYEIGVAHLAGASDRAVAAQDLQWALFNTREFLFNH